MDKYKKYQSSSLPKGAASIGLTPFFKLIFYLDSQDNAQHRGSSFLPSNPKKPLVSAIF